MSRECPISDATRRHKTPRGSHTEAVTLRRSRNATWTTTRPRASETFFFLSPTLVLSVLLLMTPLSVCLSVCLYLSPFLFFSLSSFWHLRLIYLCSNLFLSCCSILFHSSVISIHSLILFRHRSLVMIDSGLFQLPAFLFCLAYVDYNPDPESMFHLNVPKEKERNQLPAFIRDRSSFICRLFITLGYVR